jgi:hypothetical protein
MSTGTVRLTARLFVLEARVGGGDAPVARVGSVGLAFLLGREAPNHLPSPQSCGAVRVAGMSVEVRQRRLHQVPADEDERSDVAGTNACPPSRESQETEGAATRPCARRRAVPTSLRRSDQVLSKSNQIASPLMTAESVRS